MERFTSRTSSPRATAVNPLSDMATIQGSSRAVGMSSLSREGTPEAWAQAQAQASYLTSTLLPADDGQYELRQKILHIRDMDVLAEEKARLMHAVMTESYRQSKVLGSSRQSRPTSPISIKSHKGPFTPSSIGSCAGNCHEPMTPTSIPSSVDPKKSYNCSEKDLEPTYHIPPKKDRSNIPSSSAELFDMSDEEEPGPPPLGCAHYQRNVKLQCSTCHGWYTCRFCHDEKEDHPLIRKETKDMLCMLCGCPQPASDVCIDCGERAAWYYCDICKFWDNDPEKSIYHCSDCGICRIGRGLGKDFFHCKTCGVCMSISIANSHRCIERSTECDCPICGEYMFTSPSAVVFMQCGHSIHHNCYYEHMKTSYRCPICSRSVVNMETQFRNLDRAIESQPMPAHFKDTRALVRCNDCCSKTNVKFHWLGLKCGLCDSYNTVQIRILSGNDPDQAPGYLRIPSADMMASSLSSATTQANHSAGHDHHAVPMVTYPPATSFSTSQLPEDAATRTSCPVEPNLNLADQSRPAQEPESLTDTDNEDINFWGGDAHARHDEDNRSDIDLLDDEGSDSSTDDNDADEEEDDADLLDIDDDDDMELIGHR